MNDQAAVPSPQEAGATSLPAAFTLERLGDGRYRAPNVPSAHRQVVFGGQLLGQLALAAEDAAGRPART